MKKLIACAVLFGATCAFAAEGESYLFWMIDSSATIPDGNPVGVKISAIKGSEWTYHGGEYLMLNEYSGGTVGKEIGKMADFSYGSALFASVPAGRLGLDWTYYVELYNDRGIFARSDGLPYNAESIVTIAGMARPGTLWTAATFVAASVPEPSSGLLLLLGVAGLALRRRKQIVA